MRNTSKVIFVSGEVPAVLLRDSKSPDHPKALEILDKENKYPFRCIEMLMG